MKAVHVFNPGYSLSVWCWS